MSIEQINDTSQDMQLDRSRGPRNSRGQLTAVNVGPASGWKSTINKKNGDEPIIIVGSWDKREYQVVSVYAVVSPGHEVLVLRSGAVKQRYAEPESKIEVVLLNDNINSYTSTGHLI
ncbi:hypothetical protein [Xenorhabdus cabanillasii]|uniref:Uncharacterized protein n=1 Tax=Xenorhabdus cabanillasii JM26 TaxID=1427517 RepID=W1IN66_9GAMM|nr:hypothetical protein [Xenorhabdus cabanillasii]PHM76635.1 hypothetical protein Xcab_02858 [Xenorhabdus cabanillasii JM26]CDL79879.1 hypothetical protein XCR1_1270011 [Xenorhabdus cabanillasii JM26]